MRTVARCISSLLLLAGAAAAAPVSTSALCGAAKSDEIVVCGQLDPPPSPYRLPLRIAPEFGTRASASVSAERNALFDYDAGGGGLCSNVGATGALGCGVKALKRSEQQRAGAHDARGRLYDAPGN